MARTRRCAISVPRYQSEGKILGHAGPVPSSRRDILVPTGWARFRAATRSALPKGPHSTDLCACSRGRTGRRPFVRKTNGTSIGPADLVRRRAAVRQGRACTGHATPPARSAGSSEDSAFPSSNSHLAGSFLPKGKREEPTPKALLHDGESPVTALRPFWAIRLPWTPKGTAFIARLRCRLMVLP